MSYYLLPKVNNEIVVDPRYEILNPLESLSYSPRLSHSLLHYVNEIRSQCDKYIYSEDPTSLQKDPFAIVNPHEYIFSKIPQSRFAVSKLKPHSHVFYDLMEIAYTLSIFDMFADRTIQTFHTGPHAPSTIECINMLRENYNDTHLTTEINQTHTPFDFIYYEMDNDADYLNPNRYILWLIKTLFHIFSCQRACGTAIIKVQDMVTKPVLDVLYILCHSYDKVYLMKPTTSHIVRGEKYIVCKRLTLTPHSLSSLYLLNTLEKCLEHFGLNHINDGIEAPVEDGYLFHSLIKNELPYFFMNKIEEFNIIVGQQQLNAMDLFLSIMKCKNREEKVDALRKMHIQKCILWCEKYKIPFNKMSDKVNIFSSKETMTEMPLLTI